MTQNQESVTSWLKFLTPLIFFLFSIAVWGGRLETRIGTEIEQRQKDYDSVEYIR